MSQAVRRAAPARGKGRTKGGECGGCAAFTKGKAGKVAATPASNNGEPTILQMSGSQDDQEREDVFIWDDDQPTEVNAIALGKRLAACGDLFRQPGYGDGLLLIPPDGKPRLVNNETALDRAIADRVPVLIRKKGEIKGNQIPSGQRKTMVGIEKFLGQFRTVDLVTKVPMFLPNWTLTQPGYNDGGKGHRIYYVGGQPQLSDSMEATTKFLDVMDWESNADRTNAVAAALTVVLRNFWPGGKPVLTVTGNKSHSGKGTAIEFATGEAVKTAISWQSKGWPVERAAVGALTHKPDTAVLVLDNARLDKGDNLIASQFVERIATDPDPFLFSTGTGAPVSCKNNFILAITTNFGSLCEDILNRGLLIRMVTQGDIAARKSPIGNPCHEYLPANRERIGAELRGMIMRWIKAGCPLDTDTRHPFSEWAKVIGGILDVNGFADFLGNYGIRKSQDDPVRKGLGLLGADKLGEWMRATDWAKLAVDLGLKKAVIPAADQENSVSQARGIGVVFKAHSTETFQVETDAEKLTLRLEKKRSRFDEDQPHVRYRFVVDSREPIPEDGSDGVAAADVDGGMAAKEAQR
jgi:hypothetical protein